jgi:hypothetical protein
MSIVAGIPENVGRLYGPFTLFGYQCAQFADQKVALISSVTIKSIDSTYVFKISTETNCCEEFSTSLLTQGNIDLSTLNYIYIKYSEPTIVNTDASSKMCNILYICFVSDYECLDENGLSKNMIAIKNISNGYYPHRINLHKDDVLIFSGFV